MICNCSLAGTKACNFCSSNPNFVSSPDTINYTFNHKEFPIKCIMEDWLIKCPICKHVPDLSENPEWKYCPSCGQRVIWE